MRRDAVFSTFQRLGATADEVAETLKRDGIRGRCPLTTLARRMGLRKPVLSRRHLQWFPPVGPSHRLRLPVGCEQFAKASRRGAYPHLTTEDP